MGLFSFNSPCNLAKYTLVAPFYRGRSRNRGKAKELAPSRITGKSRAGLGTCVSGLWCLCASLCTTLLLNHFLQNCPRTSSDHCHPFPMLQATDIISISDDRIDERVSCCMYLVIAHTRWNRPDFSLNCLRRDGFLCAQWVFYYHGGVSDKY